AFRRSVPFELALGSARDRRYLRDFAPPARKHVDFRRTTSTSALVLHGVGPGSYVLRLRVDGGADEHPRVLSLPPGRTGRGPAALPSSLALEPGWHDYRVPFSIPASWVPSFAPESLALRAWRAGGGPTDNVGVRVSTIGWERTGSPPFVDPLLRAVLMA